MQRVFNSLVSKFSNDRCFDRLTVLTTVNCNCIFACKVVALHIKSLLLLKGVCDYVHVCVCVKYADAWT